MLLAGCATVEPPPASTLHEVSATGALPSLTITADLDARKKPRHFVQTGKATFYSGDGQPTASGERYDPRGMTAAHRTLPMQTRVRVTNLRNGREVVVRINDRGPYGRGRIIDVSLAAAKQLDMIEAGVVPAKVEVVP